MKSRKGNQTLDGLQNLIVPLVAVGIVLVVGFLIMAESKEYIIDSGQACANTSQVYNTSANICCHEVDCVSAAGANATSPGAHSSAINGTNDTINAIADIPVWLPIIIITVIGALLIGLVTLFRRR